MSAKTPLVDFGIRVLRGHVYAERYTPKIDDELRQGRCKPCAMAFRWPYRGVRKPLRLSDAHCPHCGRKLTQTMHYTKTKWLTIREPLTQGGARKYFGGVS